jgi:hypothetical protein
MEVLQVSGGSTDYKKPPTYTCQFPCTALGFSGQSHAASRTRPCCLLFVSMAGLSGRRWSFAPLLWCFKQHEWRLGRIRFVCRLARNGETAVPAYQRSEVPGRCFSRQATQALHFAALGTPETTMGPTRDLATRCGGETSQAKLNLVHQQCMSAVMVTFYYPVVLSRPKSIVFRIAPVQHCGVKTDDAGCLAR